MNLQLEFNQVEDICEDYLKTTITDKDKLKNAKYLIKKNFKNPKPPRSTLKFINYLINNNIENTLKEQTEQIEIKNMNRQQYEKHLEEEERHRLYKHGIYIKKTQYEFKTALKKKKLDINTLFKSNFNYSPLVEFIDIDRDEYEQHDGRITKTLYERREDNNLFDDECTKLCEILNTKLELKFKSDDYDIILGKLYNFCRNEFELLKTDEIKHMRQTQKDMMPKRQLGDSYKDWIKKMRKSGFYCGWCDENSGNPVPDLNAWIFLGKKLMSHLQKFRKKYDIENAENGCSPRNVYLSKMSFVEIQFNCDRPADFKKQPKIWFSGYNGMNITPTNILSMKKRFQDQFINRKLYNLLSWYGEE